MNDISRKGQVPQDLLDMLQKSNGTYLLLEELPKRYTPYQVSMPNEEQFAWEAIGQILQKNNRHFEAIQIFKELYFHILRHQEKTGLWTHKGMPLVWICESYKALGFYFHWRKYLMLTLCEDVIREQGKISPSVSGVYFRLAWHDIHEKYLNSLSNQIYNIYQSEPKLSKFPEYILQNLTDKGWNLVPSTIEANHYSINYIYLESLINDIDSDKSGKILEILTDYIFGSMPGCKSQMRVKTKFSDLDVLCSMDGFEIDFRSEFGRYFICECKSWSAKVDFSTMAKFCRVLDSAKMRFGVLISKKGITGVTRTTDAAREQLKIFQDRGIIIVALSLNDLKTILAGESLQKLLEKKYETIRLDKY